MADKNKSRDLKKKLTDRYSVLSNDDVTYERGEEEQLISHLQEKLGKSKKEIKGILKKL